MKAIVHDAERYLWCGPAAVAATTGVPTSRVIAVADQVQRNWGRRRVGGAMNVAQVQRVVTGVGFTSIDVGAEVIRAAKKREVWVKRRDPWSGGELDVFQVRKSGGTKLVEFLKYALREGGRYVVLVPGHFVAVEGLMIQDNRTRRPTWAFDLPYLNRRVERAWRVERREGTR